MKLIYFCDLDRLFVDTEATDIRYRSISIFTFFSLFAKLVLVFEYLIDFKGLVRRLSLKIE